MGLYLCVFDGDEEVDGVEVGSYDDFNVLRDYIISELELGKPGTLFPVFILHSDCDGEWSYMECEKLVRELGEIVAILKTRPAVSFHSDWQKQVAKSVGLSPQNAFESFIDVDGEFLLGRFQRLINIAIERKLPILFQ